MEFNVQEKKKNCLWNVHTCKWNKLKKCNGNKPFWSSCSLSVLWGLDSILNPRKDYQSPLPQRFPTAFVSFTSCEIPFHETTLDPAALENHNHPPHDDTHISGNPASLLKLLKLLLHHPYHPTGKIPTLATS